MHCLDFSTFLFSYVRVYHHRFPYEPSIVELFRFLEKRPACFRCWLNAAASEQRKTATTAQLAKAAPRRGFAQRESKRRFLPSSTRSVLGQERVEAAVSEQFDFTSACDFVRIRSGRFVQEARNGKARRERPHFFEFELLRSVFRP